MANNLNLTQTIGQSMLNAIVSAAGTSALLKIYDGSQPATADTAVSSQNLLATLTCNASQFGTVSGNVLTVSAITTANASATGTAAWFRLTSSGGTTVMDGTVGTSSSDLNITTTALVSGSPVAVTSWTITRGNV